MIYFYRTSIFNVAKTQKLTRITSVFVQIPSTYKKYLSHISTPANIQNNCIKLSDYSLNKTILPQQEMISIMVPEERSSNPKILSQFFMSNLTYFFHYPSFNYTLNNNCN